MEISKDIIIDRQGRVFRVWSSEFETYITDRMIEEFFKKWLRKKQLGDAIVQANKAFAKVTKMARDLAEEKNDSEIDKFIQELEDRCSASKIEGYDNPAAAFWND
ncbi:MAG: hypothetical protein KAR54_00485 [Candidatus Pacebacteria bacterium]|nr:hypothetical protein [Candidatus Paceibacterota bacterium]